MNAVLQAGHEGSVTTPPRNRRPRTGGPPERRSRADRAALVDGEQHIEELLGSRQGWTPVALLHLAGHAYSPRLLELARERRWRLINLSKFEGTLPPDLQVRGALTSLFTTDAHPAALLQRGIPVLRIGNWPDPGDRAMPAVMPDHPAAGALAAEHFAGRKFKHVGCVGHRPWGENRVIYEAFESRAAELGCQCHLLQEDEAALRPLPSHLERWRYRRQLFMDWIRTLPRPVGMLMFGDMYADRCCQWALEAGLSVPRDVAVLGIGNDTVACECATIPTSSVAHDLNGVLETAVSTLGRLMDGEPLEQTTLRVPPLGVVARQSTDVLGTSDPVVAKALRFMWEHLTEDMPVDRIARHVGVSRRKLETAFQRELRRGVNQEFQRRRLEKARDMLLGTNLNIARLAEALGFGSHHYFCRAFRAAYHTSPGRYRRERTPIA